MKAAKERERTEAGTFQKMVNQDRPQVVDEPLRKSSPRGQGSQAKAAASKTNRKRAEAARERERTEKGTFQKKTEPPVTPQVVGQLAKTNTHSKAGS